MVEILSLGLRFEQRAHLDLGVFSKLEWHKKEKEHILRQVGIEVEYGEPIDYGENKGTYTTLGDYEHTELIRDYVEGKGSMAKITEVHSVSSSMVHNHVKKHYKEVGTSGECSMCRRAGSVFL